MYVYVLFVGRQRYMERVYVYTHIIIYIYICVRVSMDIYLRM